MKTIKEWAIVIASAIVLAFFALFFVGMFAKAVAITRGQRECIAAGYPEARQAGSRIYCVKRVNGTDVVMRIR
jgi:hypothetical protein